jgi:pentatricopeptide repeat protein
MYSKSGLIDQAEAIFSSTHKNERDTQLWTSMISAYSHHGMGARALEVFNEMIQNNVKPDAVTITSILNGCSHSGLVSEALRYVLFLFTKSKITYSIFRSMALQYQVNPTMDHNVCIVDLLGRAGRLQEAEELINHINQPDILLHKVLLGACVVGSTMTTLNRAEV